MKILDRTIGKDQFPYIIAEISANHNGDINNAKRLIDLAKECGADAVKLQTYTPDTMTLNINKKDFIIEDGLWRGQTLYELYKNAQTPFEWQSILFEHAKSLGITIFSTPFDESAVDLLEEIGCPAFKIASFELTDLPLIEYISKIGKPLLISTGMASEDDVKDAVGIIEKYNCDFTLLHCVSAYPTKLFAANLNMISKLQENFGCNIGLSDHTLGNEAAIAAVTLGATVIEKHFTLDRSLGGPDSSFSLEPAELRSLVQTTKDIWLSLKDNGWSRDLEEKKNAVFRRSLYFVTPMSKGEKITASKIKRIRPGYGLPAKFYDRVLGMKVTENVMPGDRVTWELVESV